MEYVGKSLELENGTQDKPSQHGGDQIPIIQGGLDTLIELCTNDAHLLFLIER